MHIAKVAGLLDYELILNCDEPMYVCLQDHWAGLSFQTTVSQDLTRVLGSLAAANDPRAMPNGTFIPGSVPSPTLRDDHIPLRFTVHTLWYLSTRTYLTYVFDLRYADSTTAPEIRKTECKKLERLSEKTVRKRGWAASTTIYDRRRYPRRHFFFVCRPARLCMLYCCIFHSILGLILRLGYSSISDTLSPVFTSLNAFLGID